MTEMIRKMQAELGAKALTGNNPPFVVVWNPERASWSLRSEHSQRDQAILAFLLGDPDSAVETVQAFLELRLHDVSRAPANSDAAPVVAQDGPNGTWRLADADGRALRISEILAMLEFDAQLAMALGGAEGMLRMLGW